MTLYNKIKNIKYCFYILIVTFISCDDDLDPRIFGEPTTESFYKNPEQAEQALIAAYSSMGELYGSNFWGTMGSDIIFGEIGTDDFIKGGRTASNNTPLFEKNQYTVSTSNPILAQIWGVSYKGVLFSNLVIENIPDVVFEDENRKKEILAEAHFLRAFYYFDMVNSFGGVPIIDKPLGVGEFNVPRATLEESYAFIENDLKIAIADLPSRFDRGADYVGRADKGAALGMMMRVLLYQNKMGQIINYGDQLFALAHTLTPDYATIFTPDGEWNSGSLFEINFTTDASGGFGTGIPRRVNPNSNRGGGFVQATDDLRNEYEANDPRLDASLYFSDAPFGTDWYVRKYAWEPFSLYPKPAVGGNNNNEHNIRIIRLADAYLMYAEAIHTTDPATAVQFVNRVRTRARGANPTTVLPDLSPSLNGQALLDAIYHERRVELAGEGYRFHDLVRTGRAEATLSPLGFKLDTHTVIPLPVSQITLSDGVLLQNPNY